MSLSFMDLTRDQSVLDVLEEDDLLIFCRLAKRDDVNVLSGFRVHDGDRNTVQQTKRNEPLFTVIEPVVLEGKGRTLKNLGAIPKIQAMSLKVGLSLRLLPGKPHDLIVYTLCICVKLLAKTLGEEKGKLKVEKIS